MPKNFKKQLFILTILMAMITLPAQSVKTPKAVISAPVQTAWFNTNLVNLFQKTIFGTQPGTIGPRTSLWTDYLTPKNLGVGFAGALLLYVGYNKIKDQLRINNTNNMITLYNKFFDKTVAETPKPTEGEIIALKNFIDRSDEKTIKSLIYGDTLKKSDFRGFPRRRYSNTLIHDFLDLIIYFDHCSKKQYSLTKKMALYELFGTDRHYDYSNTMKPHPLSIIAKLLDNDIFTTVINTTKGKGLLKDHLRHDDYYILDILVQMEGVTLDIFKQFFKNVEKVDSMDEYEKSSLNFLCYAFDPDSKSSKDFRLNLLKYWIDYSGLKHEDLRKHLNQTTVIFDQPIPSMHELKAFIYVTVLTLAIKKNENEAAKLLIKNGVDVYKNDNPNFPNALLAAISVNNTEMVDLLVKEKKMIDYTTYKDDHDDNILHLSTDATVDRLKTFLTKEHIKTLIQQKDFYKYTPLQIAKLKKQNKLINFLKEQVDPKLWTIIDTEPLPDWSLTKH